MEDPTRTLALLATIAQSSAAIVAIVGGFLVSRLVQLSSERDGLRRRLEDTRGELGHVEELFSEAHRFRLANSQSDLFDFVIAELVEEKEDLDLTALLLDNTPRGSTEEEMRPYLDSLLARVQAAKRSVREVLRNDDSSRLDLDDLRDRGLIVPPSEEEIYFEIVRWLRSSLPAPRTSFPGIGAMANLDIPVTLNPAYAATDTRRLDDSIRDEQQLDSRRTILAAEAARLEREINSLGRPAGVTSGITILSIYSLFGIVVPVAYMAVPSAAFDQWQSWILIVIFTGGLAAVLTYIAWYARSLGKSRPPTDG
jgi:hypothetical protein